MQSSIGTPDAGPRKQPVDAATPHSAASARQPQFRLVMEMFTVMPSGSPGAASIIPEIGDA